jgi:hypothetical protein
MDIREIFWEAVDWIHVAQDRINCGRVPKTGEEFIEQVSEY